MTIGRWSRGWQGLLGENSLHKQNKDNNDDDNKITNANHEPKITQLKKLKGKRDNDLSSYYNNIICLLMLFLLLWWYNTLCVLLRWHERQLLHNYRVTFYRNVFRRKVSERVCARSASRRDGRLRIYLLSSFCLQRWLYGLYISSRLFVITLKPKKTDCRFSYVSNVAPTCKKRKSQMKKSGRKSHLKVR